ncbi:MAG: hypothetical protein ACRDRU_23385 [Pseudonocardiaceae bacterium]
MSKAFALHQVHHVRADADRGDLPGLADPAQFRPCRTASCDSLAAVEWPQVTVKRGPTGVSAVPGDVGLGAVLG